MSPDQRSQRRLTALALDALKGTGFALAGAGAIREQGLTARPTQDIDLFTADTDRARFRAAVAHLVEALTAAGHSVEVVREGSAFARLEIGGFEGASFEVDLAVDWRATEPVHTEIGPVLAIEDAVGSKVDALFGRAETRDFLDVDAIRQSGRFSDTDLLDLVARRDPGFDRRIFAEQLALVRHVGLTEVARYDLDGDQLAALQRRLAAWAEELLR